MTSIATAESEGRGNYVWRLVGFVNSRGACIFSIVVALIFPPAAWVLSVFSQRFVEVVQSVSVADAIIYYLLGLIGIIVLYTGVPKVRSQLNEFSEIMIDANPPLLSRLTGKSAATDQPTGASTEAKTHDTPSTSVQKSDDQ